MRTALDRLVSWTGLALAVVLLVAGGLLTWASSFVDSQVKDQFAMQDITMPTTEAIEGQVAGGSLTEADAVALRPFAGTPLDSGPKARAYADHYILAHMNHGTTTLAETLAGYGVDAESLEGWKDPLTYESAGTVAKSIAAGRDAADLSEDETAAVAAVNTFRTSTLFTGNTLRGLLLYGYAFATIGTIAGIAGIVCFVGAVGMGVLVWLGFRHANKAAAAETSGVATSAP
jgi:hypothetical protein